VNAWRQAAIALHVVVGLLVVAALCRHLGDRAQEVNQVRVAARQEHEVPQRLQAENARTAELLRGVEHQDPYVIELLAREKLGYGRPGEISPPPAPPEKPAATDASAH
jgi:cell division protein FtsB